MTFPAKDDVPSSAVGRGSPQPSDLSPQVLQVVNESDANERILQGFLTRDIEAGDSIDEVIEPPTAIARFMADHSDQNEDAMMMAQIGLTEDEWEFADPEADVESYHRSSTSALIQPDDELEELQEITYDEVESSNDPAIVHDQHVRAMAYHIVPPYPIPPQYAILPKPEDTSYAAQARRYREFMKACYSGNDEQRKEAIKKANEGFPRYGSPEAFVRVVHMNGQAQEVSKWQRTKCDDTCPMKKKSFLKKLAGVPGKLLGSMPYGKLS